MLRHSSEKPFVCNDCGNTFKREKTLVMHFQLVHKGMRTELTCIHCGAQFMSHRGLRAHMGIHTGEETVKREVRCSQCEKVFRCKADLESHMVCVFIPSPVREGSTLFGDHRALVFQAGTAENVLVS